MDISRERRTGPKRIGELLVAAGVIRQEVLAEALQVAKKSSTPVGRVLMTIGELTERDLLAAIEVQSMIRENLISSEFGIRALQVCIKGRLPLDEAFRRLGWQPPAERDLVPSGELGNLLLSAGIVDKPVLEDCMRQSEENNLPLGRCLVLARAVSSNMLTSALTAQVLVRDGKITYEQAIAGLQAAFRKQQTLEQSLSETGAYRAESDKVKVGDLLTQAGLVTDSDKVSAIERGLVDSMPVGQVLVQSGMVSPTVLDEALKLQKMVNEQQLNSLQAAEILRQAHNRGIPVEMVMNEKGARQAEIQQVNQVMGYIRKANLLAPEELHRAESLAADLKLSLGEVILSKELITPGLIASAMQARKLVGDAFVTEQHAIKVLGMCKRTGITFSDALKQVPPDIELDESPDSEDEDDDDDKKGDKGKFGGLFGMFKKK